MSKPYVWLALVLSLLGTIAHAEPASVQLHLVTASGTALPTRDGGSLTVGPALLSAPLAVVTVDVARSEVRVGLGPDSVRALAALTSQHRGQRIAIVVDGVVQSTPVVKSAIVDGKLAITLRTPEAAATLAHTLDRK